MIEAVRKKLIRHNEFIWGLLLVVTALYGVSHQAIRFYIAGPMFLCFAIAYSIMTEGIKIDIPILVYEIGITVYCIAIHEIVLQLILEPLIFYYLAKALFRYYRDELKHIYCICVVLILGFLGRAVIEWIVLFISNAATGEAWFDIFAGEIRLRTVHEFYLLPLASLFFFSFFLLSKRMVSGSLLLGLIIAANVMAYLVEGRMTPLTCASSFAVILVLAALFRRDILTNGVFLIVGICGVLSAAFLILAYSLDWFGIKTVLGYWNGSGGVFRNVRFGTDYQQFLLLFKYPLGGCEEGLKLDYYDHTYYIVHNVWLQIGRRAGILPFVLVGTSTCWWFYNVASLWRDKKSEIVCVLLLTSLFLALNGYYMSEIAGLIHGDIFSVSFLISGMIREYYLILKEKHAVSEVKSE